MNNEPAAAVLDDLHDIKERIVNDECDKKKDQMNERVGTHDLVIENPGEKSGHRLRKRVLPENGRRIKILRESQKEPHPHSGHLPGPHGQEKKRHHEKVGMDARNGNRRHQGRLERKTPDKDTDPF
jgi:hypothetical protein